MKYLYWPESLQTGSPSLGFELRITNWFGISRERSERKEIPISNLMILFKNKLMRKTFYIININFFSFPHDQIIFVCLFVCTSATKFLVLTLLLQNNGCWSNDMEITNWFRKAMWWRYDHVKMQVHVCMDAYLLMLYHQF